MNKGFQEGSIVALLIATAVGWTSRIPLTMDIDPWDEPAVYLGPGFRLWRDHYLPSFDWGPLYTLWYAALSFFVKDPLSAYFLSAALIVVGLAVSFYALVRALGVGALAGYVASVLLLIHPPLMTVNRRSSQFALLVILAGWAAVIRLRARSVRYCAISLVLVVGAWARPEYLVAAIPAWAASVGLLAKDFKSLIPRQRYAALALGLLTAGGILMAARTISPYKSLYVFKNFNVYRLQREDTSLHSLTDRQVFEKFYGEASSIPEAILHNPWEFLRHLADNFLRVCRSLLDLGEAYLVYATTPLFWGLLLGGVLAAGALRPVRVRALEVVRSSRVSRELYVLLMVLAFPGLFAAHVYGIIPQYLVAATAALLALLSALLSRVDSRRATLVFATLCLGASLWRPVNLIDHPELRPVWTNLGRLADADIFDRFFGQKGLKAIQACRTLATSQPLRLLSMAIPVAPYFFPEVDSLNICWDTYGGCPEEAGAEKVPFAEFLEKGNWNLIYLWKKPNSGDRELPYFGKELKPGSFRNGFSAFLKNPRGFGFDELRVPGVDDRIFVRSDILLARPR